MLRTQTLLCAKRYAVFAVAACGTRTRARHGAGFVSFFMHSIVTRIADLRIAAYLFTCIQVIVITPYISSPESNLDTTKNMSFVNETKAGCGMSADIAGNEIVRSCLRELTEAGSFYFAKPAVLLQGAVANDRLAAATIDACANVH